MHVTFKTNRIHEERTTKLHHRPWQPRWQHLGSISERHVVRHPGRAISGLSAVSLLMLHRGTMSALKGGSSCLHQSMPRALTPIRLQDVLDGFHKLHILQACWGVFGELGIPAELTPIPTRRERAFPTAPPLTNLGVLELYFPSWDCAHRRDRGIDHTDFKKGDPFGTQITISCVCNTGTSQ